MSKARRPCLFRAGYLPSALDLSPMRVFAGLPLPPPVIDRLSMLRLRLATPKDGLRWSDPEQWHITLRFFGEVDSKALPGLLNAVGHLRTRPLRLEIEELGTFAAKGILFAAIGDNPALVELQAQAESVAALCGFAPESRSFHPHITLARSRNRTGLARLKAITSPDLPSFGPKLSWIADTLLLYESELQVSGAHYRTLAEIALCPEPAAQTRKEAPRTAGCSRLL